MALGTDRIVVSNNAQVQAEFDAGLRAHMLRVYNYMASGVALTGIVAYFVSNTPALLNAIFGTPLVWVLMFMPIAFFLFMGFKIHKIRATTAQTLFWAFCAAMGLSMSLLFVMFTGASIARAFFITAGMFAGMSLYGYTTKKDLSGWGSFLIMGLIGVIIAMVVNMFIGSEAIHFAMSVIVVIIFTALTAYDTQRIKLQYAEHHDSQTLTKLAVMGALSLYWNFIILFQYILMLFGNRN